ncbi:hypothetical protein QAD02_006872 [Eretmocerus hayati]|uniref:Uncharacterized protein n=1 Tax=Eretmocerus hayati TaxID=131215 RepID=A0ACC2N240_9HYME|nr:hypothetical protein QAD02_006872 [Eretmocerus hayati]
MISEYVSLNDVEEEDVILEGSALHQALTSMGYDNFESVPRVEINYEHKEIGALKTDYHYVKHLVNDKLTAVHKYIACEDEYSQNFLESILNSKVLLDDHAVAINDFLNDNHILKSRIFLKWLPIIGSTLTVIFYPLLGKSKALPLITATSIIGLSALREFGNWFAVKKCQCLVELQNELFNFCKQVLKILSRTLDKKSSNYQVFEKQNLIGSDKYRCIISMKELMVELFCKMSHVYYENAKKILNVLPEFVQPHCPLTVIEGNEYTNSEETGGAKLKSLYYTYLLVQSEAMFIIASAYNGGCENGVFSIPKKVLSDVIKNLTKSLTYYHSKLSKILHEYQLCKVQPIKRMFGSFADSRWRDTCLHLDLASQKIQSAYQEITSIIEYIESCGEEIDDDQEVVDTIAEKMNQAYKQVKNAQSFAEFSHLLITKLQKQYLKVTEIESLNKDLFPVSTMNRIVIDLNKEPEIEDEVFEEYIREEYLKPILQHSDVNDQELKLDELLVKNFMSELKEVLIEKQKTMNEREMKALRRMYHQIKEDHTESSCNSGITNSPERDDPPPPSPSPAPPMPPLPPPPPPPPPRNVSNIKTIKSPVERSIINQVKARAPVPLPRVKMWNPENEISDVQRFSINDCMPDSNRIPPNQKTFICDEQLKKETVTQCPSKFPFPSFKLTEETFLGSGENSEEENYGSDDDIENDGANYQS